MQAVTLSLAADRLTYGFQVQLAPVLVGGGVGPFVTIEDGTVVTTTNGSVTQTTTQLSIDDTAYRSVVPTEPSTGQIGATFTSLTDTSRPAGQQTKTVAGVTLTSFLPQEGDPHGPRSGSYTHLGEPGVGGAFTFADTLALLPSPCAPGVAPGPASLTTVARWYQAGDGSLHGRSDAKATGGQIPAGDAWLESACTQNSTRRYEVDKIEDATGSTVAGHVVPSSPPASPCDAAFGSVPSLTNNATDYDFTAAPSFPNEW